MKERHVAMILAAGKGTRMNTAVQKQYLKLAGRPVLYYSLKQFQQCPFIDEIILVTGKTEIAYCRKEIVELYEFDKVSHVIAGGEERYHSVYEGLKVIENCSYVYIHDGARPFVDQDILERAKEGVEKHQACVVGMPVKDTVKICNHQGFAEYTPDRNNVWIIQTPQVFAYQKIKSAYDKLLKYETIRVTDDAMVLEEAEKEKVKLIKGSYENLKITTPEDLLIAEKFLEKFLEKMLK